MCVILTWVVSEYGSVCVCNFDMGLCLNMAQFVCVILTWVVSEYGSVCVCNFDMGCV